MVCTRTLNAMVKTYICLHHSPRRHYLGEVRGKTPFPTRPNQLIRKLRTGFSFLGHFAGPGSVMPDCVISRVVQLFPTYTEVVQYLSGLIKNDQLHNILCFPGIWQCVKYL